MTRGNSNAACRFSDLNGADQMACMTTITLAGIMLLAAAAAPAAAQMLENSKTPATSGTVRSGSEGRESGDNLSPGTGPASETKMPPQTPRTDGREHGATQAGASDTTKELFQH